MEMSDNGLAAFPIETNTIPAESEEIVDRTLKAKSKPDFKTKEEKQYRLATLAEDTRRRLKRSAIDIYCIGLNLLEAQNIIEHGEFLPWLRQEFGMGKTSAYEFIHVAKAFEPKFPIIGNLINNITSTALYKLAAPSTCQAARDEAIDIAKAGEVVNTDVAKNLIDKYKTSKTANKKQQKTYLNSQQSDINQGEALGLSNAEVPQIEQTSSSISQQEKLQNLLAERDTYKVQLEALQRTNEQLKLDVMKVYSKLTLLLIASKDMSSL
ncbi:MAG: DUF3102 domain-containing protein [Nostoc sp. DedVER02]|uniref:DUF3102 domain-containing protein n=1 Tax=unclassified Nostoc TaxID=2593658 RepID=UPI002AD34B5F|nr:MULTISPECIES: DUF3102 domain-containing protein [unclassified Nostoc]MDZ7987712.1 DUF3102 domain-containing protein [Nostoc sp. DedVER02]MDZ8113117.1 DUF3102 domain-containing protein [Nostoc sp. DedVER01b]